LTSGHRSLYICAGFASVLPVARIPYDALPLTQSPKLVVTHFLQNQAVVVDDGRSVALFLRRAGAG
jgi:hypothetical protein